MTHSEKMLELLEKGQLEEAKKEFGWALRKDDDQMIYSLAEELYSLGFSKQSRRAYEKLLERYPDEDGIKTALADIEISDGNDDRALELLAQITPDSDSYLEALLVSADLYQTQGMFDVSEQKLLEARRLAPDETVILFGLAELYFNVKEYRKAARCYLDLVKSGVLEFSKVNLVSRLGLSYAGFGKLETALGYLEQIPEEELDSDTRFQLAFIQFQQKDFENAQKNFEKLRDTNPDYSTLYPYLTAIYEHDGNLAQALRTAQEGLGVDEFNMALYEKAAELSAKCGEPKKALEYLKHANEIDPEDLNVVLKLSRLLVESGLHEENIELVNKYLENDEADPELCWNLGKSCALLDKYDEALRYYVAAERELGENPEFLKDAAYFYRNAGERKRALACAKKALETFSEDYELEMLKEELEF